MTKVKAPDNLRSVKALYPRALVLGLLGFEYLPFIPLYAITINACIQTSGEPYAAALAHYKAVHNETRFTDTLDEWNMPSWEPELYDPFAELEEESGFNNPDADAAAEFVDEASSEVDGVVDPLKEEQEEERSLPNPFLPNFWCLLALVGVCLGHGLCWFIQRWSVRVRTALKWSAAPSLHVGSYAYCTPLAHQGAAEIVPVQSLENAGKTILYFDFQRQRFELNEETQEVKELHCPIDLPLKEYVNWRGMPDLDAVKMAVDRYGNNSLHIPVPTFQEIFGKQILGPVPVFQYLCTLLWLVDQYWNYALFNMFSIAMFEASTAFGRLKNLSTLRGMRNKEQMVQVYRSKRWSEISSVDLVPGDIFSLKKDGKEETGVPCDALIIGGSAVVNEASLTGESTPQIKEAAVAVGAAANEPLDILSAHRVHTLYSGTSLMQVTAGEGTSLTPPDGGCMCYCLRTGFSSSQGQLVRMIEYSSEQVMSDVKETLALLFLLLVFALMASGYVLKKGLEEGKKSQYELVLRCVLILTSVVPPELPMQTAVAVNTALLALWKSQIFCTEPFRIPYAGKIKACLFDKTGTLTTDQLVCAGTVCFKGTEGPSDARPVEKMETTSWEACVVLGACHALVKVEDQITGDPIEVAGVKALGWDYQPSTNTSKPGEKAVDSIPKGSSVTVLNRYHFASKLQRMSVLAHVREPGTGERETWALVKGSPEAIAKLLVTKPAGYDSTYRQMAEEGMRVLALAYRKISTQELNTQPEVKSGTPWPREEVEKNLVFAGFIAFVCPVRKDSALIVKELQRGAHKVIMATGDAALTALHVGAQVGITSKDNAFRALQLEEKEVGSSELVWRQARLAPSPDQKVADVPYRADGVPGLVKQGYDLLIVGDTLRKAAALDDGIWEVVEYVKIYARMAPDDKERVIRALRERGEYSLMCGDGANDVGALKQAHVGVALLSGFGGANTAKAGEKPLEEETEEEKKARIAEATAKAKDKQLAMAADRKTDAAKLQEMQKRFYEEELTKLEREGVSWAAVKAMKNATSRMMEEQKKMVEARRKQYGIAAGGNGGLAAQAAMMASDEESGEVPMVKLGDASVAAPFTSKLPSVKSCVDVIRQGRCTLVSTIQMQQILALNCLIAAYSLSALYLDGIRSGEAQMIASGLLLTIASLAFSYATPVKELSPVHPITTIFHPAISLSIVGQLLIHLYCMVFSINLAKEHSTEEELFELRSAPPPMTPEVVINEDGTESLTTPFRPTLLNTVVFLIETAQQVSVMAVNYKGRPFMIASTENRPMLYSLAACCAGTFIAAFEVIPELNSLLQLVPLPSDAFRFKLLRTLGLSVFGSLIWDRVIVAIFAPRLMWVGYVDAWKAMPPFKETIASSGKTIAIAAAVGLWLYTNNMGLMLCGYYLYRQFSKTQETLAVNAAANQRNAAAAPPPAAAAAAAAPTQ